MAIRKHNPYPRLLKAVLIITFIIGLAHSLVGCDIKQSYYDSYVYANGNSYPVLFKDIQYPSNGCIQFPRADRPGLTLVCGSYSITPRAR